MRFISVSYGEILAFEDILKLYFFFSGQISPEAIFITKPIP
jgi:hypothetical protein